VLHASSAFSFLRNRRLSAFPPPVNRQRQLPEMQIFRQPVPHLRANVFRHQF
jgi:hypothetical protein